ncbi:MAG: AAA family ATPase [Marinilabiliales bacterium]|nr:MAG: AAA family ATPase [Marinilabiliales bacterium]
MRIKRNISNAILGTLSKYPVIGLTGPRQSGKTTLLKTLLQDYSYVSLENPDNRDFALSDPNGFLKRYSTKVIIDEAQRAPALFSYIQSIVDDSGIMGQFILSGSQNFHLMQEITQSLAGRVAIFKLFPFDFQEMQESNILNEDYIVNLINGFYPALYDRGIKPQSYYSNYFQTYLQRDVSELIEVKNQSVFKKFLRIIATRAGQILNMNSIANECGISQPTVKSWLSALESSYIIFTLSPYYENFGKRLIKSPKLYFYDTGLLCYLLRIKEAQEIYNQPIKGSLFENMIIAEHAKRIYHMGEEDDYWFWRDSNGNEIDLLYYKSGMLYVTEIKANQTVMSNQFKGLEYFERNAKGKKLIKQLVYAGEENQDRNIGKVISWKDFGK